MTHTFVIAEAGSSHDNDLAKGYRLIEAAKECGADAVKFQWTSNAIHMANRRNAPIGVEAMYAKYLEKPVSWLESLKAHADKVGVEFMCTVYLIEDIATIAPLVKRFKVSAFESEWYEFIYEHTKYGKEYIISKNRADPTPKSAKRLWCVSKYPTPIEEIQLRNLAWFTPHELDDRWIHGLSDHTTSTLTGALAVAAGATIIEKHIRLHDTDPKNPDYGHSLVCEDSRSSYDDYVPFQANAFKEYVHNIREAERAM